MSQDLRNLFEKERQQAPPMPDGHEARFLERLNAEFPRKRNKPYLWLGVAACVVGLLGLGIWLYPPRDPSVPLQPQVVLQDSTAVEEGLSLGDLSPDLKKLEQYYAANISMELASLDISDGNKAVADGYLERLRQLDAEYKSLSRELNEIGPNEETITAMIRNFQLRLDLLQKLKAKLNELKQSKNETVISSV